MHYFFGAIILALCILSPTYAQTISGSNILHIKTKIGYEASIDMGGCGPENIYTGDCASQFEKLQETERIISSLRKEKLEKILENYLKNPHVSLERKLISLSKLHQLLYSRYFIEVLGKAEKDFTNNLFYYYKNSEKESLSWTFNINNSLLEKVEGFFKQTFDAEIRVMPPQELNASGEVVATYVWGYVFMDYRQYYYTNTTGQAKVALFIIDESKGDIISSSENMIILGCPSDQEKESVRGGNFFTNKEILSFPKGLTLLKLVKDQRVPETPDRCDSSWKLSDTQ